MAPPGPVQILLVEPDEVLAQVLTRLFQAEGWVTSVASTSVAALGSVRATKVDVVVTEAGLEGVSGTSLAWTVRALEPRTPVLVLVSPHDEPPVADGRTTALGRPFPLDQVTATIRAELVRSGRLDAAGPVLRAGDLVLDEAAYAVTRDGRAVQLSPTEFGLLRYLLGNRGRILPKSQILNRVWNYDYCGNPHVVETYISSVRRKLGGGTESVIQTVRGVGYTIADRE